MKMLIAAFYFCGLSTLVFILMWNDNHFSAPLAIAPPICISAPTTSLSLVQLLADRRRNISPPTHAPILFANTKLLTSGFQHSIKLKGHQGCVNTLSFSFPSKSPVWSRLPNLYSAASQQSEPFIDAGIFPVLVSGSDDRCVLLWNPFDGTRKPFLKLETPHRGNIFSAIIDGEEKYILSGSNDGILARTALEAQRDVWMNSGSDAAVFQAEFLFHSYNSAIACYEAGSIRQFDFRYSGDDSHHVLLRSRSSILGVASHPSKDYLFAYASATATELMDMRKISRNEEKAVLRYKGVRRYTIEDLNTFVECRPKHRKCASSSFSSISARCISSSSSVPSISTSLPIASSPIPSTEEEDLSLYETIEMATPSLTTSVALPSINSITSFTEEPITLSPSFLSSAVCSSVENSGENKLCPPDRQPIPLQQSWPISPHTLLFSPQSASSQSPVFSSICFSPSLSHFSTSSRSPSSRSPSSPPTLPSPMGLASTSLSSAQKSLPILSFSRNAAQALPILVKRKRLLSKMERRQRHVSSRSTSNEKFSSETAFSRSFSSGRNSASSSDDEKPLQFVNPRHVACTYTSPPASSRKKLRPMAPTSPLERPFPPEKRRRCFRNDSSRREAKEEHEEGRNYFPIERNETIVPLHLRLDGQHPLREEKEGYFSSDGERLPEFQRVAMSEQTLSVDLSHHAFAPSSYGLSNRYPLYELRSRGWKNVLTLKNGCWLADNRHVAIGSEDNRIHVWRLPKFIDVAYHMKTNATTILYSVYTLLGHGDFVNCCASTPPMESSLLPPMMATSGIENFIRVWSLSDLMASRRQQKQKNHFIVESNTAAYTPLHDQSSSEEDETSLVYAYPPDLP
ncbi:WD domain, G-beta repeat-containing protein, partial [Cardiosporidium cionae]